MKTGITFFLLGFALLFTASCQEQKVTSSVASIGLATTNKASFGPFSAGYRFSGEFDEKQEEQIGEYVRRIFLDKNGSIWCGTNGEGAARYDGKDLVYFTTEDGLS